MTFEPMLARSLNPNQVGQYINDPTWYAQQKLDGLRILITVQDGQVSAVGRSGRTVELDPDVHSLFAHLEGLWRLDGEWVDDGVFYAFDMPNAHTDLIVPTDPYWKRAAALSGFFQKAPFTNNPDFKIVEVAKTAEAKQTLLDWCKTNHAEGVMFKQEDGQYISGIRSNDMLKHKFTETVDVVILEVGREGKESCSVGAFHNGLLTDIGSVKMTYNQGLGKAVPGDVIEVRYLYATSDLRLYQPVFLKFRPDRDWHSCTTDQLKYTNKSVKPGKV